MLNSIYAELKRITWIVSILILFYCSVYSQIENDSKESSNKVLKTSTSYCNFNIPKSMKLANLSFFAVYSFKTNKNSEAFSIEKIRDEYIGDEIVKNCISDWKIVGFPENSQFKAYFYWNHSMGWIRQTISGDNFTQTMETNYLGTDLLIIPENEEKSLKKKIKTSIKRKK